MTTLLDLPTLARNKLLDFLPPRDALKLRRVCSSTKAWVADYIPRICLEKDVEENNPERNYIYIGAAPWSRWYNIGGTEVRINGTWQTFDTLASLEWRVSSIKILNGPISPHLPVHSPKQLGVRDVYKASPGFDRCVLRTFPFVRKVTVTHFNACLDPQEWAFFSALTSMDELTISVLWLVDVPSKDRRFPPTFKNLRFLKVSELRTNMEMQKIEAWRTYHWNLIRFCSKTHNIARPCVTLNCDPHANFNDPQGPRGCFQEEGVIGWLKQIVTERTDMRYPVRIIDMECIVNGGLIGSSARKYFTTLIPFCAKRHIKMINVHSHLYTVQNPFDIMVGGNDNEEPEEPMSMEDAQRFTKASIRSLIQFTYFIKPQTLTGVECIEIASMLGCCASLGNGNLIALDRTAYINPPPAFPELRQICLRLDVDTEKYSPLNWEHFLLGLLSISRPSVRVLSIEFDRITGGPGGCRYIRAGDANARTLTAPNFLRPVWLANNFVCVTKLMLTGWDAKNIHFLQVWKGMPQLEDLFLSDCHTLGNVGFIGEDPSNPVFLQLKDLRVLTLNATFMPKITDRAFKDVFSKMRLKRFTLQSDLGKPLQNITKDAIRALADPKSQFAKSIQEFPIEFLLAGPGGTTTTHEELYKLRKLLFRPYH